MKSKRPDLGNKVLAEQFVALACHSLEMYHLPRIERCLKMLAEKSVWWRPNDASNSVGNLVLHLAGNVRQWIISGLGGKPDHRERDKEFAQRAPIPRPVLLARLQNTVSEAIRVLGRLTSRDLARMHSIQGFRVTGLQAVCHVMEHFAYHAGQIIFVAKLQHGQNLGFTQLPGEKPKMPGARNLAQL